MKKIAFIGTGVLADVLTDLSKNRKLYDVVGYFDDVNNNDTHNGLPIFGKTDLIKQYYKSGYFDCVFIAIGYTRFDLKEKYYNQLKGDVPLANIIHPESTISENVTLGEGIFLSSQVYITYGATIEDNVSITLRSVVNHDSVVKKHTFFSTNVVTAGNVTIGEKCFIGVGCTIADGINICDNVWLSPGCIVVKDIKKSGQYISSASKLYNIG